MKIRDQLGSLSIRLDQVLGRLHGYEDGLEALADAVELIGNKVEAIQPARVDLTQEMADDIVSKIHGPLTIGQEFSDWIKQEAKYHDVFWTAPLGYGSSAGQLRIYLKTNGTVQLEMLDRLGARLWFGTFVPPDFGRQS